MKNMTKIDPKQIDENVEPASGFRVYQAAALYVPVCVGEQRTHSLFFRGGVPRRIENMRFALGTGYR